jgi:hypothetical protein
VIDPPSSSNVPQDNDKDKRVEHEDTPMNKERHKQKMLMLSSLPLKWLKEEILLYFKHILKISS